MKLGGLFSGVGGFELAWTQLGHEVAWMCEIDKSARKVLEARFPGVPIYEDVEQLDPAEVEAVDVLTGGSPCQGFSVAGMRSGLEHGESRLFADYIRIMDGLAERGLRWALWENVPGVLSIQNDDGERTFEHVVTALVGGTVPVRLGHGRWNTGLADGGGRAVAWRVLDSRYFGVAQRRRRVFACVAFGDSAADRAGRALLAKSEGVSGDSAASRQAWEAVAGSADAGVAGSRIPELAGAVGAQQRGGQDIDGTTYLPDVPDAQAFNWQSGGDARGLDLTDETSALTTQQTPAVLLPEAKMLFVRNGVEVDRHGKKAGKGALIATEEAPTLDAGNHWTLFQPQAFRKAARARSAEDDESWVDDGQANTPNTFDMGDTRTTHAIVEPSNYGVRRLTPVECERLQAFPDGWTEPAGSDSARYKAMGNAVTVNTVRWVLGRMLEQS
jgi:DNA (cytosine-5)-methyltransferase 1